VDHIAIDLGSRESQACVRSSEGLIGDERCVRMSSIRTYLRSRRPGRVIVETCAEAFKVADVAKEYGHEVRVVPASLVRALGVGARGLKTDQRDARALSEASCRMDLPSVHSRSISADRLEAKGTAAPAARRARDSLTPSGTRSSDLRPQNRAANQARTSARDGARRRRCTSPVVADPLVRAEAAGEYGGHEASP
jgi:hypothetical protein